MDMDLTSAVAIEGNLCNCMAFLLELQCCFKILVCFIQAKTRSNNDLFVIFEFINDSPNERCFEETNQMAACIKPSELIYGITVRTNVLFNPNKTYLLMSRVQFTGLTQFDRLLQVYTLCNGKYSLDNYHIFHWIGLIYHIQAGGP